MSRDTTKPTKWLCAQRRLRSAWASPQSDQSLRCPHEESLDPYLPTERTAKTLIRLGGCPGWSESSLGAHSFCWFCHVADQIAIYLLYHPYYHRTVLKTVRVIHRHNLKASLSVHMVHRPDPKGHFLAKLAFRSRYAHTQRSLNRVKDRWTQSHLWGPPRVLGNRRTSTFISGEQGNTGNREHRKSIFWCWGTREQSNLFQGNKISVNPPGLVSSIP